MNTIAMNPANLLACTCVHGGGGHVPACPLFMPTREQYAQVCAERDKLQAALKMVGGAIASLNDPVHGVPWWLK